MIFRGLFAAGTGAGAHARLSVLIFHRVLPVADPLFADIPDARRFAEEMRWVRDWFNVLPLTEAIERLRKNSLPPRALAISFDDGYADNRTVAAPILQSLGLSATFFVTTGVLDGGRMWNDTVIESIRAVRSEQLDLERLGLGTYSLGNAASRRVAIDKVLTRIKRLPSIEREAMVNAIAEVVGAELPLDLMMSATQVRELSALGMDVGGHTVTHPILTRLDDEAAYREMAEGREALRAMSRSPVELFAYPNGVPGVDYDARHVALVRRCGFAAALTTAAGVSTPRSDVYQLPRFRPWDRSKPRYALRLLLNLRNARPVTV